MDSSRSSTPDLGYYKLPPIITTEADRQFLSEVNAFIDSELGKINHLDEEERYLVYKTVFNKVIEHVTAYKPVLVQIKKEYEDTIDTIKKGQREATFLQEKLKAMASEPSTLRNYRKRADELEERTAILRKKNEQLQQEINQIKLVKEEKEKRPKTTETPERELKKDSRLIPGLSIEDSTDIKILQKKHETLDRQLKELSLSLRARFLPKTHKLQLKESLDNKVTYRDQLLWQSQVYKARGQKLKIALEAAQAYNQMKPPHQTVGDAVTIAFQQASGMLKAEREKTEGEQADNTQTSTFEDDDPNKEKEAEMMLEYIEKFNELFEDGLFEEAAVHAANSPKGILRTQATLAKFRDVKANSKGRSPLLAFCDSIMSSVRAAGSRPNEALSMDCMEACLNENRLDLAYHWLSQDRLTQSVGLGRIISQHCSCPLPCKCGCQALAQSVFTKLKCHQDVVLTMFKQGKFQGALLYGRLRQCINDENISVILSEICNQNLVNGLMEGDTAGHKCLQELNFGSLLLALVDLKKTDMASNLIQNMLKPPTIEGDATTALLSLNMAVTLDTSTTPDQWMVVLEALHMAGYQDTMFQLLAMNFVVDAMRKACKAAQEDKKGVSFSAETSADNKMRDDDKEDDMLSEEDNTKESSVGLSSRSRDTTSIDHSSRETSPEVTRNRHAAKGSILKKKRPDRQPDQQNTSSPECTPRKSVRRRVVKMSNNKESPVDQKDEDDIDDNDGEDKRKKKVSVEIVPGDSSKSEKDHVPCDQNGEQSKEAPNKPETISGQDQNETEKLEDNEVENVEGGKASVVQFESVSLEEPDINVDEVKAKEEKIDCDGKNECDANDSGNIDEACIKRGVTFGDDVKADSCEGEDVNDKRENDNIENDTTDDQINQVVTGNLEQTNTLEDKAD